jgi:hypothetical protein
MLLRQYHWYEMGTLGGLLSASSTEQRQDTASPVAEKGTLDGLFSAFSTETEAGHYLGYGRDTLGGLRVPSSGSTTPGGLFGGSSTEAEQGSITGTKWAPWVVFLNVFTPVEAPWVVSLVLPVRGRGRTQHPRYGKGTLGGLWSVLGLGRGTLGGLRVPLLQ